MPPAPATLTCPRCGHSQDGGAECNRCGVIFAKARQRSGEPPPEPDWTDSTDPPARLTTFMHTPAYDPDAGSSFVGKALGLAIVLALVGAGAWGYNKWRKWEQAEAERASRETTTSFDNAMYELAIQQAGNPEQTAIEHAIGHAGLKSALGGPLKAQPEGSSDVRSNGKSGDASIQLRVTGSSGKHTGARVQLVRENGRWRVTNLSYDPPLEPARR